MDEITNKKERVIDSLKLILEKQPANAKIITSIVKEYMSIDKDTLALFYVGKLLEDEKNKEINEVAEYRLIKADILFRLKNTEEALILLNKNLDEEISLEKKVDTNRSLAEYYQGIGDFEKSLAITKRNEKFYLIENDSIGLLNVYSSIASVYLNLNRKKEAIAYLEKANLYSKNDKPYNKAAVLINLSILLNDVEEYSSAIEKMNQAKDIAVEHNVFELFPIIYKSLGIIHHQNGAYRKSNEYCLKSFELAKKSNLPENQLISLYQYIGRNYYYLKEYTKAIFYLKKVDQLDVNNISIKEWDGEVSEHPLINSYLKTGNNEKAFETLKKYTKIKSTAFEEEQALKLNEVVERYENDKKEIEIEQLNVKNAIQKNKLSAQRQIIYLVVVLLITVLLLGFVLYKMYRNRLKLKRAEQSLNTSILKQRFLRMQLNPHFLFHSLCSIENYIYKGKKEEAAEFLQDFSKLMRSILESSDVDFISLKEEMSFIEKYIKLQQLTHDHKFDYSISVDETINKENSLIPPVFIQPFIENAILHGALSIKGGFVSIEITKESETLVVRILDNGINDAEHTINSNKMHRSMSMNIIQQRIENLKKTFNYDINYSLKNRKDISKPNGTLITLSFPIMYGNIKLSSSDSQNKEII
jgi:tetratricopeptide (TPR) repeat protein